MEILGVGPLELFLVIVVALIIMGPTDMAKAGRTLGRWLRNLMMSPEFQALRTIGKEMKEMPTKLMREAQLEDLAADIQKEIGAPIQAVSQQMQSTSAEMAQLAQQADVNRIDPQSNPGRQKTAANDPYAFWTNPELAKSADQIPALSSGSPADQKSIEPAEPPANASDKVSAALHSPQTIHKPALKTGPVLLSAEPDDEELPD